MTKEPEVIIRETVRGTQEHREGYRFEVFIRSAGTTLHRWTSRTFMHARACACRLSMAWACRAYAETGPELRRVPLDGLEPAAPFTVVGDEVGLPVVVA